MAEIRPLRGIRPPGDLAGRIIAPPYDVPSEAEARALAASNPYSFLHITRPEVDLPPGADPHGPDAYAGARAAWRRFLAEGWLIEDREPRYYLYTQACGSHVQTGLLALCPVRDYDEGRIRRHELTRPDKEQDRVDHIQACDAQTGLVFLAMRDRVRVVEALRAAAEGAPEWMVHTDDGVDHILQVVQDQHQQAEITAAFAEVPALYVADGHHRAAAASRVAAARGGQGESAWFLAGIFPASQLRILAYNRLVRDLAGRTPAGLLTAITADFELHPAPSPEPTERGTCTMYLDGAWHALRPRPGRVPADPVGCLDVSVLQERLLGPLLGITDPRRDARIAFVGGIRGAGALQQAVDAGEAAVAFHLYPTGMEQLLAVADAGLLMPPKSTWFEPKLRGGVLAHRLDEAAAGGTVKV